MFMADTEWLQELSLILARTMMCILMTMNGDGKINSNDDATATF